MAASWNSSELRRLDVDEIWRVLGRFGRYQLFQLLVFSVAGLPMAFPILTVVFQGDTGPFKCQASEEHLTEFSILENATFLPEQCRAVSKHNDTDEVYSEPCVGYLYDRPRYTTFVSEFDLVCEQAPLAQLSQTLVMAGMFVGAFFLSPLADKYGRKLQHVACHVLLFAVSLAMAFVPNFAGLAVTKFLAGVFHMGYVIPWSIGVLELFPTEERAIIGMGTSFVWAISVMILSPIAYITRHYSWRTMQIATAVFSAFSFLEILLLDESLRWLVTNQRFTDVRRVICKASRLNGKDPDHVISASLEKAEATRKSGIFTDNFYSTVDSALPLVTITEVAEDAGTETPEVQAEDVRETTEENKRLSQNEGNDAEKAEGMLDLFKDSDMRFITLSVMYMWMTCSITYYGLTLLSSSLAGNKYVNFFLGGLLEIPSNFFLWLGFIRMGRKKTTMIFISIAWVSLLAASLVAALGGGSSAAETARTGLSLAGRFGIAGAFNAVWVFTPELFPTNLRNVGVGVGSSSARVSGMAAPFFRLLIDVAVWAPGAIFSALCLLMTLMLASLPETTHRPLPQTVQEVKTWREQDRKKKKQSQTQ